MSNHSKTRSSGIIGRTAKQVAAGTPPGDYGYQTSYHQEGQLGDGLSREIYRAVLDHNVRTVGDFKGCLQESE